MQRDEWTFTYPASRVLEAVDVKIAHHEGRLAFWQAKNEETMQKVRADGISVKESVAGAQYTPSAAFGPQVMVNAEYQRDLNECHQKAEQHAAKVKSYRAYRTALDMNPGASLTLNVDDVEFFFGK